MKDFELVRSSREVSTDITIVSPDGANHHVTRVHDGCDTQVMRLTAGDWAAHNRGKNPAIIHARTTYQDESFSSKGYYWLGTVAPEQSLEWSWSRTWSSNSSAFLEVVVDSGLVMFPDFFALNRRRASDERLRVDELLFEDYCGQLGLSCSRIDESRKHGEKTPDYLLNVGGIEIPTEIKAFEPNPDDKENERLLAERGYGNATGRTVGHRLALLLKRARPQLRAWNAQHAPGPALVVVADFHGLGVADPVDIAAVLEGHITVQMEIPSDRRSSPCAVGTAREPSRESPHNRNQLVSAIGVLNLQRDGATSLSVFHNPHAQFPLDNRALTDTGIKQYRLH